VLLHIQGGRGALLFRVPEPGPAVTVVRYFNVYGPRLDRLDVGRIITIFLGQAFRDKPLTVIGDGLQTRCFTYVADAVAATVAAGVNPNTDGEIFNIGTDVETAILHLARDILSLTGSKSEIHHVTKESVYGSSYEDIPRRVPDVTKMHGILGVRADTALRAGLEKTIAWFRDQP